MVAIARIIIYTKHHVSEEESNQTCCACTLYEISRALRREG